MRIERGCVDAIRDTAGPDSPADPAGRTEGAGAGFGSVLVAMRRSEREVDAWVARMTGPGAGTGDPRELLRLQITVQRFQTQIELASRLTEQAVQAVRTLTKPV